MFYLPFRRQRAVRRGGLRALLRARSAPTDAIQRSRVHRGGQFEVRRQGAHPRVRPRSAVRIRDRRRRFQRDRERVCRKKLQPDHGRIGHERKRPDRTRAAPVYPDDGARLPFIFYKLRHAAQLQRLACRYRGICRSEQIGGGHREHRPVLFLRSGTDRKRHTRGQSAAAVADFSRTDPDDRLQRRVFALFLGSDDDGSMDGERLCAGAVLAAPAETSYPIHTRGKILPRMLRDRGRQPDRDDRHLPAGPARARDAQLEKRLFPCGRFCRRRGRRLDRWSARGTGALSRAGHARKSQPYGR